MKTIMQLADSILDSETKPQTEEKLPKLTDKQREGLLSESTLINEEVKGKKARAAAKRLVGTTNVPGSGELPKNKIEKLAVKKSIEGSPRKAKKVDLATAQAAYEHSVELDKKFTPIDDVLNAPYISQDSSKNETFYKSGRPYQPNKFHSDVTGAKRPKVDLDKVKKLQPNPYHSDATGEKKPKSDSKDKLKKAGDSQKNDASKTENLSNYLTGYELSVIKEAISILKKVNEGSGGTAKLSRKLKSVQKQQDKVRDSQWSQDSETRKKATSDVNKLQKTAVGLSKRLGKKQGEGDTRPLKRALSKMENVSCAPTTVGTVGSGPLKSLGKGKVSLLKSTNKKKKKANESFKRFLDKIINEVKR